jgi:S-methylmethionine-dependent homocysteine/selenocysteine methylase/SAM-dependent methyltransferase
MASALRPRHEAGARGGGVPKRHSPAYSRIKRLLSREQCVVLDGAMGTELEGIATPSAELRDDSMWGTWALANAPEAVTQVHRSYADVGCDLVSTNTWGLQSAMDGPGDWMVLARRAIRLARDATAQAGRSGEVAVAFSLHGDVSGDQGLERLELLARAFEEEPPDVVLLETMSLIHEATFEAVGALVDSGYPVWLSFRRCRHGLCGVFGEHWGGPEGDLFGRAARRFEEMGVDALLINCIPPDHVPGILPWLRGFTDMPLGVYPNLGYYTESGWAFDHGIGGTEYAELALAWRDEGAEIVGGCCGVRPEHIAAARAQLAGTRPGRPQSDSFEPDGRGTQELWPSGAEPAPPWTDERGRRLYPAPMPELIVEPGVFVPTPGSFLIWKHLFAHGTGAGQRCLDVGCGTGLLAVQLALNGAEHVHAVDIDKRAVANTLTNAFRNQVADRVSGAEVDLFPWDPDDSYDVVVASLYQMPNDPFQQLSSHRPLDYWGRNLFDHLLHLLPSLLRPDGVAYVMQLSILSQRETLRQLELNGLRARVADFSLFEFSETFSEYAEQIRRVEEQSDAYHVSLGESGTMVAYLLEIERQDGAVPRQRQVPA